MKLPTIFQIILAMYFSFTKNSYSEEWQHQNNLANIPQISTPAYASCSDIKLDATLSFVCYRDQKDELHLEVEILKAAQMSTFAFDQYEGPDAAFGTNKIAVIVAQDSVGITRVESIGSGWFDNDSFKMSMPIYSLDKSQKAILLQKLQNGPSNLEITFQSKDKKSCILKIKATLPKSDQTLKKTIALCSSHQ